MENSREKQNRKDNSNTITKHERNIRRIPAFSIKGQWRIEDVFECKKKSNYKLNT